LPMSIDAGPRNGEGDTRRSVPSAPAAVTSVPSARSAPVISSLSRLTRGPRTRHGVSDNAANTRARLVIDFEPGRERRGFHRAVRGGGGPVLLSGGFVGPGGLRERGLRHTSRLEEAGER